MLRIERLRLENFRCFETLDLQLEADITVLFAENGGGKSAVLSALAMALGLLQPRHPKELSLDPGRDARRIRTKDERWEAAGQCAISSTATIGTTKEVEWGVAASATSRRRTAHLAKVSDAIEKVRAPGERWPLLGYYGTARLGGERKISRKIREFTDRWDGYDGCFDSSTTDGPLLGWLQSEAFGDLIRHRRGEEERRFDLAVLNAIKRATPGVSEIWYDPAISSPRVRFDAGHEATWAELSDGFHVFMGLIGDIARRAVMLNGHEGADAPLNAEGVALVDEIDLHLHPQWQRVVLDGLRAAFPKLQFILTTHSPQVLSSALNRQVRKLVGWRLENRGLFVEGRDSNAILREQMETDERDEEGQKALRELHKAIDDGETKRAKKLIASLRKRWGDLDPELIRAEGLVEEGNE